MFHKICMVVFVLAFICFSFSPQALSSVIEKESRIFWPFPGRGQLWILLPNVSIQKPAAAGAPAGGTTATTCAKKSECIAAGKDKCSTVDKNTCGADPSKAGTDKPSNCYIKAGSCVPPVGVTKACGSALCPA